MSRDRNQWERDMTPAWGHVYLPPFGCIFSFRGMHALMPIAGLHHTAASQGRAMLHSMAPLHAAAATAQHAAVGAAPSRDAAPKKNGGSVPAGRDTRRAFLSGVVVAAAGAGVLLGHVDAAPAASKRRAPPPPSEEKEKKDPNLSGVQAKVLASRKRKEAMKEAVAKLREKGKNPADAASAVTGIKPRSTGAVVE
ncbi:uncharacterized protein [Aegilops tauschii subsp. strangulata]|nr:uncharacterized protein LOC109784946 [Aegilops tauschii subsp. strangulata]